MTSPGERERRLTQQDGPSDEIVGVVFVRRSGRTHVWTSATVTHVEQADWLARRFGDAMQIVGGMTAIPDAPDEALLTPDDTFPPAAG